jgi:acetyl/propionyl-CoA carboxylase alpha subunit
MKIMQLEFGALDFIVDPEGNWWFLEVNPSGQWLWIETLTGLDISGEIAQWLISTAGGNQHVSVRKSVS